jgi:hypothetical protein
MIPVAYFLSLCVHGCLFVHLLVIVLTLAFGLSSCQKWIIIIISYYYYYCYIHYSVLYFIYKCIVVVSYFLLLTRANFVIGLWAVKFARK